MREPTQAAIASRLAAEIYGLEIIRKDIEDESHNTTRFVVLSATPQDAEPEDVPVITTFVFRVRNVPAALYRARSLGYDIDVENASFFLGHRKLIADAHHGLPLWQDYIYISMAKNAVDATDYFRIPPSQVVEIGSRQIV